MLGKRAEAELKLTLDGGKENASNWKVFMRRSWRGLPCSDFVAKALSWSAVASVMLLSCSSWGTVAVAVGEISSTAEEKRTAGTSLRSLPSSSAAAGWDVGCSAGAAVDGDACQLTGTGPTDGGPGSDAVQMSMAGPAVTKQCGE